MYRTPTCSCHDGSRSIKKKKNYGCLLNRYEYDYKCAADNIPFAGGMAEGSPHVGLAIANCLHHVVYYTLLSVW